MSPRSQKLADLKTSEVTLSATDEETGETLRVTVPVVRGTCGAACIDISKLAAVTGLYTLDPGFTATSSCRSAITYIDGPAGVLLHRGYAINDLAAKSSFLEVCYLLLNGTLPSSKRQLAMFKLEVTRRMTVHERLRTFVSGFPDGAHPMAVMVGTVGALSAFYCRSSVGKMDEAARALAAIRVVAKLATIAAMAYKHSIGQPFAYPRRDLSFAGNFLHLCFSSPLDQGEFKPPPKAFEEAIDVFLLLHADHEQNASTSTVRLAGSSEANPFACVAAGIASLWGPMHGGANEAVVTMLREIGDEARIPEFLRRAKDKNDPFKLMGFGHRVYKNVDPRAKEMRRLALACIAERERQDAIDNDPDAYLTSSAPVGLSPTDAIPAAEIRRLFKLATKLEEAALEDDYFVQRKLFPNVDFYSGLALTAIGIPTSMFTCLFAVGRAVGWISHWKEFVEDEPRKIGRPRQLYVGEKLRRFPTIEERDAQHSSSNTSDSSSSSSNSTPFTERVNFLSPDDAAPHFGFFI
ncbi:hypothetical protein CTAYLR_003293 [Chrysophaeum taylorii]|uniref:Citrate synthase n=1 Tax=Chrysophaeum taylorii TaxID=2483200 RepID=A0AAD7UAC1_9STRA|nr:hypothetical protein CTAYLR_003293 [Chrysophaeum taylorii]